MKRNLLLLVVFLCVASVNASITEKKNSADFDYKFECDTNSPTGYSPVNAAVASSDGNILTFNSVVAKSYISDHWPTAVAEPTGWTFEAKFKIGIDYPDDYHIQFDIGSFNDDPYNKRNIIKISANEIYIYNKKYISTDDLTAGFHTLRVAQEANSSVSVFWLDDNQIATCSGSLSITSSVLQWGAMTASIHGAVYFDYIRFTGKGAFAPGPLVPVAKEPSPTDGFSGAPIDAVLKWSNDDGAFSNDIYFGTSLPDVLEADRDSSLYQGNIIASDPNSFVPSLDYGTTYYWRIDVIDSLGALASKGKVWQFTTIPKPVPEPSAPIPNDGAADISIEQTLSWTNGNVASSHDIYFGTNYNDVLNADRSSPLYRGNIAIDSPSTFSPELGYGATYYWRVDAINSDDVAQWKGDVWRFTTYKTPHTLVGDLDGDYDVDIDDLGLFFDQWLNAPGCLTPDCADFDSLNGVDVYDFAAFAKNWNTQDTWYQVAREAAKNRKRRVLFDNDGCDIVYFTNNVSKQSFWDCRFTGLLGTQTDTVFYCTWSSGFGFFSHNTKLATLFNTTDGIFYNNKVQAFIDTLGVDNLDMAVEFCHDHDMELFWTMRMNDVHNRGYVDLRSPLIYEHPEWLVGSASNPPVNGSWTAVDYTHQEIRDLLFSYVQEVCQNYDIDGVMLDFFRHPVFFKSHADGGVCSDSERAMMTDLISRIRVMVDDIGRRRGRPILISIRTPDDPTFCRDIGLDIENWMANNLIDLWVPTSYWRQNTRDYIVNLGHSYGIPVYPSLDESRASDSVAKNLRNTENSYSGRAAAWLEDGADGIFSFNYDRRYAHMSRLDYLGSLDTLAPKSKTYTTSGRGYFAPVADSMKTNVEDYLHLDYIMAGDKNLKLNPNSTKDYLITVADDCAGTNPDVRLKIRSDAGIGDLSDLRVSVNDHPVACNGFGSGRMYLDSAKGYTVEWRIKWLATDTDGVASYACIYAGPQENSWWMVRVYLDSAKIYADLYNADRVVIDEDPTNTDYHKIRVTVTGGMAYMYVDDNPTPVASRALLSQVVLPLVFGDLTNAADGRYKVDYVYAYDGGAVAAGSDPEWTMRYEANEHPTSLAAAEFSDGTTGSWAQNFGQYATASEGSLDINTLGSDRGTFFSLSEPSWYDYIVDPSYMIKGKNLINFDYIGPTTITIDDLVLDVNH